MKMTVKILENEFWWGGTASGADKHMPLCAESDYTLDLLRGGNQTMPLYVSSKGRYIWSEKPFVCTVKNGDITLESDYDIILDESGTCLKDAYLNASKKHFPFSGKVPNLKFFETAQYNTWMEFDYNPTQAGVIDYAEKIVKNGYKPGILIIDEGWHTRYGLWEWDFAKFPDPKAMIERLHELGFSVMLWVVPYITTDGLEFCFIKDAWRKDINKLALLRNDNESVSIVRWWNGYSAVYNMKSKVDIELLKERLDKLMSEYGVDGFKFDGGAMSSFLPENNMNGKQSKYTPDELNIAWNDFGMQYEFHEYKDTFKGGGRPSIQRIQDRDHQWEHNGLATLIPTALSQGLIGHPFICPDMVGGGSFIYNYTPGFKIDEELFVRMAQCSALFPMMQFSWAPWRVLSEEGQKLCKKSALLHAEFADYIIGNVKYSAKSGEPIIRHMEYMYPHCGYERINEQFFVGDKILVAPVIKKGETEKQVVLPEGKWSYLGKTVYEGGKTVTVFAPIDTLPYFIKVE